MDQGELPTAVTYTHLTSELREVTMGCLNLEIDIQSCFWDNGDQGLMDNIDKVTCWIE